jgi:pentatricopeptide repeat protein
MSRIRNIQIGLLLEGQNQETCMMLAMVKPRNLLLTSLHHTYVMLLRKFGRWGFLRLVFIVWKKVEKLGCSPEESAYNALIDALVEKGMVDMARKYDEEMLAKGLSAKPRAQQRIS